MRHREVFLHTELNHKLILFDFFPPPSHPPLAWKGLVPSLFLQREGGMLELHRGIDRLFIPPAEEAPRNISISVWLTLQSLQDSAASVRITEELSRQKSTFWAFCQVCAHVCFSSCSPQATSVVRVTSKDALLERQKGPVSAGLTTRKRKRRMREAWWEMEGQVGKPPPIPMSCALAQFSWDFNIDLPCILPHRLGKKESVCGVCLCACVRVGECLSMWALNNGSNWNRRRWAGNRSDESRSRALRLWDHFTDESNALPHLSTSLWFASTLLSQRRAREQLIIKLHSQEKKKHRLQIAKINQVGQWAKFEKDRWECEGRAGDVVVWQSICRQVPQWPALLSTSIIAFLDTNTRARTSAHTHSGDRWVNCPAKCVFLPCLWMLEPTLPPDHGHH